MRRGKFHYVLKSSPGVCWWRNIFVQDQHVTNRSRISISNGWGNQRWRKGDWMLNPLSRVCGENQFAMLSQECFISDSNFRLSWTFKWSLYDFIALFAFMTPIMRQNDPWRHSFMKSCSCEIQSNLNGSLSPLSDLFRVGHFCLQVYPGSGISMT